jgi:hypothetical protein
MVQLKWIVLQHTTASEHPQTSAALNFKVLQTFGHPCLFDVSPYAWIILGLFKHLATHIYMILTLMLG